MNIPRSHTSIFSLISNTYGRAVLLEARLWEKLACRIADDYCKITFLHSCLRNRLTPRFLRMKPAVASFECFRTMQRFQTQTMKAIINDLHRKINRSKERAAEHRTRCLTALSNQHYIILQACIRQATDRTNARATNRLTGRTHRLQTGISRVPEDNKFIHNLSDKTLTQSQVSLLKHDVGYNIQDADNLDFIAALETAVRRIDPEAQVRDVVRLQVANLLMGHKRSLILSRDETEALKQLKVDPSIVILPADKGRATVVMNRPLYTDKALELLKDSSAYRVVSQDPTTTLANATNKVLTTLKRKGRIDDDTLRRLRPGDLALARFYGLPKIHKVGVPLRPIVSFRNTPTSGLAKWLSNRINYLVQGSSTTVKSAEEFISRLSGLRIEEDETMVSFDVVSLFTSIPQELAIDTIRDLLTNTEPEPHGDKLRPEDLVDLLRLCLTVYFTFQGVVYEQIKGTPMGSPISSVIAEAVLQRVEHVAMTQLRPKFWARYVDDTFVVIKKSQQTPFMTILNSVCADIQFTMEDERQGKLAFLDVLVHRQKDGTFHTKVYRKPTHTDRILHFCSNHPMAHKVGCIRTLFKRVNSHCNTASAKAEERKHLFCTFRQNGYPIGFIKRYCSIRGSGSNTNIHNQPSLSHTQPPPTRIALPYIHNVSEATARILAPYNIRVAHRPGHTLRSAIMRPKDPLPTLEKSGVIYKISCKDCPRTYIGETAKRVKTRVREHQLAIKRGESYSQLWTHIMETGHSFDLVDVGVLATAQSKSGRLLKEAWLSDEESLNRHIELHQAYATLRTWQKRRGLPPVVNNLPSLPPSSLTPRVVDREFPPIDSRNVDRESHSPPHTRISYNPTTISHPSQDLPLTHTPPEWVHSHQTLADHPLPESSVESPHATTCWQNGLLAYGNGLSNVTSRIETSTITSMNRGVGEKPERAVIKQWGVPLGAGAAVLLSPTTQNTPTVKEAADPPPPLEDRVRTRAMAKLGSYNVTRGCYNYPRQRAQTIVGKENMLEPTRPIRAPEKMLAEPAKIANTGIMSSALTSQPFPSSPHEVKRALGTVLFQMNGERTNVDTTRCVVRLQHTPPASSPPISHGNRMMTRAMTRALEKNISPEGKKDDGESGKPSAIPRSWSCEGARPREHNTSTLSLPRSKEGTRGKNNLPKSDAFGMITRLQRTGTLYKGQGVALDRRKLPYQERGTANGNPIKRERAKDVTPIPLTINARSVVTNKRTPSPKGERAALIPPWHARDRNLPLDYVNDDIIQHNSSERTFNKSSKNAKKAVSKDLQKDELASKELHRRKIAGKETHEDLVRCARPRTRAWCRTHDNNIV